MLSATQSRIRPGGASILTPNTIFATTKRIIIRNPTMLGLRESTESFYYVDITGVRVEKGVLSSTIAITMPGLASTGRRRQTSGLGLISWGREEQDGLIEGIPKDKAESLANIIRDGIQKARSTKDKVVIQSNVSIADEITKLADLRQKGLITEEEFTKMKQDLINKS
ncbi:MAG: SHOCT domain-containing protein [Candidatus Nitrosotenuis sp.]